jgi:hypothetical protein
MRTFIDVPNGGRDLLVEADTAAAGTNVMRETMNL